MDRELLGPPEKLLIPADGPIEYLGRLDDGAQFMTFVTGAVPDGFLFNLDNEDWQKVKRWIGVLHLFDGDGTHLHTDAKLGGYDIEGWDEACDKAWAQVDEMFAPFRSKKPTRCDIYARPFSVKIDGVTHGLIYEAIQSDNDGPASESVMLEPRDVMFHPPWDSGEWST